MTNTPRLKKTDPKELVELLHNREHEIRKYLNSLNAQREENLRNWLLDWLAPNDPVRIKNLEKIAGYLHTILFYVADPIREVTAGEQAALSVLLEQLGDPYKLLGRSAWELADLLEVETIRYIDDASIKLLVCRALDVDLKTGWAANSQVNETMQNNPRQFLMDNRLALIAEYRRDRAKAEMRGMYLLRMTPVLLIMLIGVCMIYLRAESSLAFSIVLLVAFAGAMGSVLSYALKIGKGTDGISKEKTVPLGIRALTLTWKLFFAQPVIGAAVGLIISLFFAASLQQLKSQPVLGPDVYAVLGFLAGFSEPFFIGIVDKVVGELSA